MANGNILSYTILSQEKHSSTNNTGLNGGDQGQARGHTGRRDPRQTAKSTRSMKPT